MDASEYPQPLWERAVAQLQANGQPLTAQSIQAMMNTLVGDAGSDGDGPDIESKLDAISEGYAPSAAPNPAPVDRVMIPGINPATGRGMDQHAYNNLIAENTQGPGKLKSDDAAASDPRSGANSTSDTSNYAPGTQGMGGDAGVREGDPWKPKKGAVGTFIDDLFSGKTTEDENGIKRGAIGSALNSISMPDMSLPSGGDLAAMGGVGALLATLLRRGKPGAPGMQSTRTPAEIDAYKRMTDQGAQEARGNRMIEQRARGQAIDAMQADRAKSGAKRSGRGGGGTPRVGGRRKNPYEPDMTLM